MSANRRKNTNADVPVRLALSREDAAAALGMSVRQFEQHVQPHVRVVRCGELNLYPIADLERWVDDNAQPPEPRGTLRVTPDMGRRDERRR